MRLLSFVLLTLGFGLSPSIQAGDQKLVSVEVTLKNELASAASGIRTLYIILHDSKSQMPRPLGAIQVPLKADAKGLVYKSDVKASDVSTMGGTLGSIPETLRVKARLDKDGSGGPDQPGDIVGSVSGVTVGGVAKIVLDNVIAK